MKWSLAALVECLALGSTFAIVRILMTRETGLSLIGTVLALALCASVVAALHAHTMSQWYFSRAQDRSAMGRPVASSGATTEPDVAAWLWRRWAWRLFVVAMGIMSAAALATFAGWM